MRIFSSLAPDHFIHFRAGFTTGTYLQQAGRKKTTLNMTKEILRA
jgi:hypothetical protein